MNSDKTWLSVNFTLHFVWKAQVEAAIEMEWDKRIEFGHCLLIDSHSRPRVD